MRNICKQKVFQSERCVFFNLVRACFPVHKVLLLDALQVFVLLEVLAHLHMFWVGLEIRVSRRRCFVWQLQLDKDIRDERGVKYPQRSGSYIFTLYYLRCTKITDLNPTECLNNQKAFRSMKVRRNHSETICRCYPEAGKTHFCQILKTCRQDLFVIEILLDSLNWVMTLARLKTLRSTLFRSTSCFLQRTVIIKLVR